MEKTNKYGSYLGGTSLKSIADLYDEETGTFHITAQDPNSKNTGAGKGLTEADLTWAQGSATYNQDFKKYMDDMAARFHITAQDPNSKNTGAGKGLTEADLTWAQGSATYNQDFKKYMDDMAARIAVYEASSDPVLRSHLPGMYNAMANYENQRNAKLMAMGRGDLVTNNWQAYSHSTKGWEKDINDVGNGAGMLSAEQIAGFEQTAMGRGDLVTNNWQAYSHSTKGWEKDINDVGNGAGMLSAEQIAGFEQTAAKLQNAFEQATNDYQREEIWKDLASLNLMLGRAWDASTGQWSASTVSPVKDYYGSSGGAYSYGAMTNGSMTGEAAQALAGKLLQQKKDQAANYGSDGVNWYENPESLLEGKPRIEANANLWPNINGWTISDLQSDYEMAKVKGDTAAMDAAHAAAEALRQQQGYSGGPDGSQHISLGGGTSDGTGNKIDQALSLPGLSGNLVSGIVGNVAGGVIGEGSQHISLGGGTSDGTGNKIDQALSLPGLSGNLVSGIVGNVAGGVIGELLPGMMGGQTGQVPQMPQDAYLEEYLKAQEDYRDYMEQAAQNAQNAIQSGVDSAVAGLNNQKGTIQQAGDIANQAAQQTYMDVINPNGATAEQLAALGLRSSGLTESSVISAGNTLQSSINSNLQNYMDVINPNGATAEQLAALGLRSSGLTESSVISAGNTLQSSINSNLQNVNNQLAQIDLAITQAKSQGNIAAAQALEQYYSQIASQMMNDANTIDLAITQAKSQGNIAAAQALEQYYSQIASQMMNDANTILAYRQQQQAQQMQYQQWLYEMQQSAAQNAWNQQFQQQQAQWGQYNTESDRRLQNQMANRDTLLALMQYGYKPTQNAWNQQFQQQQAQWGQYNTESDRRLQNQMANRDTLLALMQYGYKPTEQDAANTGYTLAQLNAMYNSIKNAMRSGLYG